MNCWEYKDCPPEIHRFCPAYPDNGHECWKIPGTKSADGEVLLFRLHDKIERCFACDFYVHYGHEH